jgi:hypothetical protein
MSKDPSLQLAVEAAGAGAAGVVAVAGAAEAARSAAGVVEGAEPGGEAGGEAVAAVHPGEPAAGARTRAGSDCVHGHGS